MNRKRGPSRISSPVLLLGTALLLVACDREVAAPPQPGPPRVTVALPVSKKIVEWDRFVGRFQAVEEVEIRARISGYLESFHFKEGAIVEAGDLLFVIDPRPFEAELAGAQARVKEALATRQQAGAQLTLAQAELTDAKSREALASSRLERARKAVSTNAIAKEEVDVRETAVRQAEAGTKAAEARIAAAQAGIATAEAAIVTAEAAVRRAEIDVGFCRIRAPIGGRIGRQSVTRGNLVDGGTVGGTLLTTIVALDPIHCEFNASEQDFLKYSRLARSGQRGSSRDVRNPVYTALIDEVGYPHKGHMDFVDNRIDDATATISGRAIFRNPDLLLTPGLFASVRIPGSGRYEAIMIPDSAIGVDQAQRYVLIVNADDVVERRTVELGPKHSGMRIVRKGLAASDRFVTSGLQRIRPGAKVEASQEKLDPPVDVEGLPDVYEPVPREEWIPRCSTPIEGRTEEEGK